MKITQKIEQKIEQKMLETPDSQSKKSFTWSRESSPRSTVCPSPVTGPGVVLGRLDGSDWSDTELFELPPSAIDEKELAIARVELDGLALEKELALFQSDREVVLAAVNHNGCALEFAADHLKDDYAVVLKAVRQRGWALRFASSRMKNNDTIVFEALKQSSQVVSLLDDTRPWKKPELNRLIQSIRKQEAQDLQRALSLPG